jgi:hypothetical protein
MAAQDAGQRAIEYLSREVPRWANENRCYSCHNNGDAARAVYAAVKRYRVPEEALRDTTEWLANPSLWDSNRGDPAFSDKKLARIQFASALATASNAGFVPSQRPLIEAAESLLPDQETDGAWLVDGGELPGSPVTYGNTLATYMARNAIERANQHSASPRFADSVRRANQWLLARKPASVPDAAALLLAFPNHDRVRHDGLEFLTRTHTSDGGWGPHLYAPAEAFDTALALLALAALPKSEKTAGMIGRGRQFLLSIQQPAGGWPETTRPSGSQSYAQHISTSGWAALALLATDAKR